MTEDLPQPYDRATETHVETSRILGADLVRRDAALKVTGVAHYADDCRLPEAIAFAHIVGAEIARGEIEEIDIAETERQPGVLLVLTHRNAPRQGEFGAFHMLGRLARARPELAGSDVRYRGEPVALVVADSPEAAREAAGTVRVRYRPAPAIVDLDAAEASEYRPEGVGPGLPPDTAVGDFEAGYSAAPVKIDVTYETGPQHHSPMEPPAALAQWDGDRLTVWASQQNLGAARTALAATFDVPVENVRVISEFIGGGFGAKLPINPDSVLAAMAARVLGRPVRLALTRRQMFTLTGHRSAFRQRIRLGAERDGTLTAIAHDSLSGTARFEEYAEQSATPVRALYAAPHRRTSHRLRLLDLQHTESMRAPGEAPGLLALESAIDELAVALGMDPVELRLANEPDTDPETGKPFGTRRLTECLGVGAAQFGWATRDRGRREGEWQIGYGVAAGIRPNKIAPASARVVLTPEGRLDVECDMTDVGTGSYTILAQVAAEATGLPMDLIGLRLGDTDLPKTTGSGGSLGAGSAGSAVFRACTALARKLADFEVTASASPLQWMAAATAGLTDGTLSIGNAAVPLADIARRAPLDVRSAEAGIIPSGAAKTISSHSYAAQFAEVAVNRLTGETRVQRMLGVFDIGRVLNARTARSQLIGGMIGGIGAALHEEGIIDRQQATFVAQSLADYHVPVSADIGDIDAICLDGAEPEINPLGSKGAGEISICGVAAAVGNAICDATGVRVRTFPATPDRLLTEMQRVAKQSASR
ncbi:MAG: xanthine dehydrogenase family protein molybdopterin-binding subunit [Geminicoccaceae bacterium]|nr:xanthine dehydrogenase family protein molybdopterin-binding subunit [Geminicoccaceae bacterium]